jgi:hypothetical protein
VASQSHSATNMKKIIAALLNRELSSQESTAGFADVSHETLLTQRTQLDGNEDAASFGCKCAGQEGRNGNASIEWSVPAGP